MNLFDIENQCRMCEISGQAVRDVLVKTPRRVATTSIASAWRTIARVTRSAPYAKPICRTWVQWNSSGTVTTRSGELSGLYPMAIVNILGHVSYSQYPGKKGRGDYCCIGTEECRSQGQRSKDKVTTIEIDCTKATFGLKTNYSHSRSLAMAKAKLGDKPSPISSLSKSGGSVHPPGVDTRFWID